MMDIPKINMPTKSRVEVKDLSGIALDWAVSQTMAGGSMIFSLNKDGLVVRSTIAGWQPFSPTNNNDEAGILFLENSIEMAMIKGEWTARCLLCRRQVKNQWSMPMQSLDYKEAGLRAVVASKFGDTVDIPDELVKEG